MRTGPEFEAFLARLYTDRALQGVFLEGSEEHAREAARAAGLSEDEAREMARIDRLRLRLACESLEKKRAGRGGAGH